MLIVITVLLFVKACNDEDSQPEYILSSISLCSGGSQPVSTDLDLEFYASQDDADRRTNAVLSLSTSIQEGNLDLSNLTPGSDYWIWIQGSNDFTNWGDILIGPNYTHRTELGTYLIGGNLTGAEKSFVGSYNLVEVFVNESRIDISSGSEFSYFSDDVLSITTAAEMTIDKGTQTSGAEDTDKLYTFPYADDFCQSSPEEFVIRGNETNEADRSSFFNENDADFITWDRSNGGEFTLFYADGSGNTSRVVYRKNE